MTDMYDTLYDNRSYPYQSDWGKWESQQNQMGFGMGYRDHAEMIVPNTGPWTQLEQTPKELQGQLQNMYTFNTLENPEKSVLEAIRARAAVYVARLMAEAGVA